MNERSIVAAILASGIAAAFRDKGSALPEVAQQTVSLYHAILTELAKSNLPPSQSTPQGSSGSVSNMPLASAEKLPDIVNECQANPYQSTSLQNVSEKLKISID